jgi:hypothetical protein
MDAWVNAHCINHMRAELLQRNLYALPRAMRNMRTAVVRVTYVHAVHISAFADVRAVLSWVTVLHVPTCGNAPAILCVQKYGGARMNYALRTVVSLCNTGHACIALFFIRRRYMRAQSDCTCDYQTCVRYVPAAATFVPYFTCDCLGYMQRR